MIFARLYREDLITGEPDHEEGFVVLFNRGIHEMHDEATRAARRYGSTAYRIYQGTSFKTARPLSCKHLLN